MKDGTRAVLAVLLLGLLGVAGCADSGDTAPEEALPRPFGDALHYDRHERDALHTANEQFIAGCMRQRGFAYEPQRLATGGADPQDANPYGLLIVEQARQDGYGMTSARLNTRIPDDPNKERSRRPRWRQALLGTKKHEVRVRLPGKVEFFYNSDACLTKAREKLYGADYERLHNTYQVLSNQVITTVRKAPGYLRAQERWASCMREAGIRVRTLDDPRTLVDGRLRRAAADPEKLHGVAGYELELSAKDADCQRKTGLARTIAEAQGRAEESVAGARHSDLVRLRELRSAAVHRAADG